ncbi:MAG: hypothetical protein PHI50_04430, partial [Alphaproteobacteria bacterium]|nr:hypothetical protein [Alphaproteobacteria bacterium]
YYYIDGQKRVSFIYKNGVPQDEGSKLYFPDKTIQEKINGEYVHVWPPQLLPLLMSPKQRD